MASIDQLSQSFANSSVHGQLLSFCDRALKLNTEEDAAEIVKAIEDADEVTAFELKGNSLGTDACKAIGSALLNHKELERALWSDMFTGRMKTEIPAALKFLSSGIILAQAQLVELDLSDNALGPNGMNGILDLLMSPACFTLRELRLDNDGLGPTGGKMLSECLTKCYEASCKSGRPLALRLFSSGRGRLENEGSIALAKIFKTMGSLVDVSMPQNGIQHKGIAALADAFAFNKNLRRLNLNDNTFTEKGAKAMATAIKKMDRLEYLNFGDCLLRSGGGCMIAKACADGVPDLQEIDLTCNEMNTEAGLMVVRAVAQKSCLQKLALGGNQFGEDGVEMIINKMDELSERGILQQLDDDEGTDEEEDEGDDDAEEEEEESSEDEDEETAETSGGNKETNEDVVCSVSDFLQSPSPKKLQSIPAVAPMQFISHLGSKLEDVEETISAVMKIASVVHEGDQQTREIACTCAESLIRRLLENCNEFHFGQIGNSIMVHLGLIKSENKKFKPATNLHGCLIILQHVVPCSFFPENIKCMFKVFFSRSNHFTNFCKQEVDSLLKLL